MLNETIRRQLITAEAKSLATHGPLGVNVVPVYSIDVTDSDIVLYNFFMGKTIENIETEPVVALAAWSGFVGVQVKAKAEHVTSGQRFDEAVVKMKERFSDRTLKGILVLTPFAVYDVSADVRRAGKQLSGDSG